MNIEIGTVLSMLGKLRKQKMETDEDNELEIICIDNATKWMENAQILRRAKNDKKM